MPGLFDTWTMGDLVLPNRIVMAPLTRMRSRQPGNIPHELNALYYAQRASAGLIVSEASQISPQGQGYPGTPGIHTDEQVVGWTGVTKAVHDKGGRIILQLWHVGRISHSSLQPGGAQPVAPSAIAAANSGTYSADWKPVAAPVPRALDTEEIPGLVADYRAAAQRAKDAGFDGVEVHGANGYLLDQFLQDGSNKRTDLYGGSIENRARLLLEVVDVAISVWGRGRVGVRLSPSGTFNDMHDSDPAALFTYVLGQLDERGVAYVHLIEPRASLAGGGGNDAATTTAPTAAPQFRRAFRGPIISAGGYTPDSATEIVSSGLVEAVAFGRIYIANPDLPERIRARVPLNAYDRATFYGGTEKGYTDYPFMR